MQKPDANDWTPAATQISTQPASQAEVAKPIPQPVSNTLPDKSVKVPEYAVAMAGDATPIKNVIHAVTPPKDRE